MSMQSTGLSKEERGAGAFRPLTIKVNTAAAMSGVSPAKIWAMIKDGRLPVTRLDGSTLVHYAEFESLLLTPDAPDAPKKITPTTRKTAAKATTEATA
jgi:hypothetical protein